MILYQIITTYHLLCALVHKEKFHKDEECVLIIPTFIVNKFPQYQELGRFFNNIIVMDMTKKFVSGYPKKHIAQAEKLLKDNKLNIKDFVEIHSMGCQFHFGSYLVNKKIPFYFWEEAAGILSRSYILEGIEKGNKNNGNKYEICKKAGLYDGSASCVIKRYCNYSAQEQGYDLTNTIDFSVVKELMSLE
ncbi:MAG: hypothetical protein J6V40_03075, partial [Clostridia bacterium]|nr:hypothetical protein [Clostridia bacterium]